MNIANKTPEAHLKEKLLNFWLRSAMILKTLVLIHWVLPSDDTFLLSAAGALKGNFSS